MIQNKRKNLKTMMLNYENQNKPKKFNIPVSHATQNLGNSTEKL